MPFIAAGIAAWALSAGVVTTVAGVMAIHAVVGLIITTVVTVGLNYVAQSILAPHKGGASASPGAAPGPNAYGINGTMQSGDTVPRSFVVGHYATAGSLAYVGSYGGGSVPNSYLVYAVALADLPSGELTNVIIDEKRCVFNTGLTNDGDIGYSIAEFELGGEHYCWVNYYDGTQTSADPHLVTNFGSDPDRPWDSSCVGFGETYAVITFRLNQGMFPGFPRVKFEFDGTKLYDTRLDNAAGGSGSQLFNQPSSWSGSSNPIVGIHNILRGIRQPTGLQNLVTYSDDFTNWTNVGQSSVPSTNNLAPDGTSTASKLAEANTTPGDHRRKFNLTLTADTLYTFSVYVKAVERSIIYTGFSDKAGNSAAIYVDLSNGSVTNVSTSGASIVSSKVSRAFNGYWRIKFTFSSGNSGSTPTVYVGLVLSGITSSYAGTVGSGVYIWGAQIVEGSDAQLLANTAGATADVWTWFYGLQDLSDFRVPFDALTAAATTCDTTVTDGDAGSEAQFRWGAEISVDMQPADVIDEALKACNARCAEIGGLYKFSVGAAGSAVYSYDDRTIMVDYPQTLDQFPDDSQLINGVNAKYPEPVESWNMKDAPSIQDLVMRESDGGRDLKVSLSYGVVPYKWQVQRLMSAALEESRKFRRHTEGLPPSAYVLEPNDIIAKTSTMNSYSSKLFRVDKITALANLDVMIAISEVDPADYDFDPANDYSNPVINEVAGGDAVTLTAPSSLSVTASFKALVLKWTNVFNFHLEAIEIWRSSSSSFGGAAKVAEVAPYITSWIDDGLTSTSQRWYWIRYRNTAQVFSSYEPTSAGAGATNTTVQLSGSDASSSYLESIFASAGLVQIEIVATLPTVGNFQGRTVFLTADNKLYRYTGSAFTKVVDPSDFTGVQGAALNSDPNTIDINAWTVYNGTTHDAHYSIVDLGTGGKVGASAIAGAFGSNTIINRPLVPVDPNKTYRAHMWYKSNGSADGVTYLQILYYDQTGTYQAGLGAFVALSGAAASTAWQEVSMRFGAGTVDPIPSGAYFMAIAVTLDYTGTAGLSYAQDIRLEEAVGSTLIAAGTVLTEHLTADIIVAGLVAAGAIDATSIIVDNIIYRGHLIDGSVTSGGTASDSSGPGGLNNSSGVYDLISVTFTGSGSSVLYGVFMSLAITGVNTMSVYAYMDGGLVYTDVVVLSGNRQYSLILTLPSTAASHTWHVELAFSGATTVTPSNIEFNVKDWFK